MYFSENYLSHVTVSSKMRMACHVPRTLNVEYELHSVQRLPGPGYTPQCTHGPENLILLSMRLVLFVSVYPICKKLFRR